MARQSCRRFCSSHNHSPPTSNHICRPADCATPFKQFRAKKKRKLQNFPKQQLQEQRGKKKCTFGKKQCCLETKTSHRHLQALRSLYTSGAPEEEEEKISPGQTAFPLSAGKGEIQSVSRPKKAQQRNEWCVYGRV